MIYIFCLFNFHFIFYAFVIVLIFVMNKRCMQNNRKHNKYQDSASITSGGEYIN